MNHKRTETEKSEIYDRYTKRRDELGLKNAQVARLAGIGQYDLTKWKKGEYMPGAKKLLAICEVLGMDLKWLLTGEGEDGKKVEEMEQVEKEEDPAYRETVEALKRLPPVKRNLIIALIAACAEDTPLDPRS